eukprot:g13077.t1
MQFCSMRGDDELLELLGIMGRELGGHGSGEEKGGSNSARTSARKDVATTTASTDELEPACCVPETGWNRTIWNPHVRHEAEAARVSGPGVGVGGAGGMGEAAMRLVSPQEEVLRQQAVAAVFAKFQVLGKELGIRAKNEMFERWQFSRKLKEGRGGDPILPAESFFDPALDAELRELGVHKSQSRNLCCELGRASKSALKTLRKQLRGLVNTPGAGGALKRRVAVKRVDGSTYVLQLGKNKLRMNSAHYDKMKELFRRACVQGSAKSLSSWSSAAGTALGRSGKGAPSPAAWAGDFHDSLFACLMRYEALQGGGFQASMGGDAFDVLLRHLGVKMECFASPFNCRYSRYCSAFKDTDQPFGSVGSFFDFQPTEGAYEANPPFVRDVILKMANHMDNLLQATSKVLTFVVIIPFWEDSAGWQRLRDSAFLSKHVKLDQKDHGYCEGKQHLRRNRYRIASFHTSIFFLQTEAARRRHTPETLDRVCRELGRAFALRQEDDGSGGGGGDGGGDGDGDGSGGQAVGGDSTGRVGGGDDGPSSGVDAGVKGDGDDESGRRQGQGMHRGGASGEDEDESEEGADVLPASNAESNDNHDGETRPEHRLSPTRGVVVGDKISREIAKRDAEAASIIGAVPAARTYKNKRKREGQHYPQRGDGEAGASPAGGGEEDNGAAPSAIPGDAGAGVPFAKGKHSTSVSGDQPSTKKKEEKRENEMKRWWRQSRGKQPTRYARQVG